jgi:dTDP-4-amino-4,6-dideoxygalactose transaminase
LFEAYRNDLKDIVELPIWHSNSSLNGSYMPIKLKNIEQRIRLEKGLEEHNIEFRQYFSPSLDFIFNDGKTSLCPTSEELSRTVLCLPLHAYMTKLDVDQVTNVIKNYTS